MHSVSDGYEHEEEEETTEYERRRRANILRNQAYLEQVGFSSAKLAVRTAICDEATKEAAEEVKRQKTEERRAVRATQLAVKEDQPVRKSRRIQRATEEREMEETNRRAARRAQLQSLRRFADNARSRRLRQRNSRKLASMRLQEKNHSSDEDQGEVVGLMSDSSTEAGDMKSSEGPSVTKVKASTHELGGDDALLEAQAQPLVESKTQSCKDPPADSQQMEMPDFERQRRANILRNQAFMQQVGVSIAKLAARTSIGDEAGKEAKRRELAAKRELMAARKRAFEPTSTQIAANVPRKSGSWSPQCVRLLAAVAVNERA